MVLLAKPCQRWSAAFCELPSSNELVLFGGRTTSGVYQSGSNITTSYNGILSDTWVYKNSTSQWSLISATNGPTKRYDAAFSYDGTAATLTGGTDGNVNLSDTFSFNGTSWTQASLTNSISASGTYAIPSTLRAASMAYNSAPTGTILTFGNSAAQRHYVLDLWQYVNPASWSLQTQPTIIPNAREYAAFASNGSTQLLFGGKSFDGCLADTYTYSGGVWTQITGLTPGVSCPQGRFGANMIFHSGAGVFILYGGVLSNGNIGQDTWTFNTGTSKWTQLTGPMPPARSFGSMAYLTAASAGILFAGLTPIVDLNDMWSISTSLVWSQLG